MNVLPWTRAHLKIMIMRILIGIIKLGIININSIYSNKSLILIFIISELFFFSSFFYINFSTKIFNNINQNFNIPLQIFKLNTIISWLNLIILLTSSLTFITAINQINNHSNNFIKLIIITITLRFYFTLIQLLEYTFIQWNSTNSLFISNFYLLTLFHITHVLLGTTLIIIFSLYIIKLINIKPYLTLTCWYWHFIDLIWLIIVILIY